MPKIANYIRDGIKAKSMLGWEPKVPLEEGLERTIDYFRRTLK